MSTRERILDATLAVVSAQGLRRMSLESVGQEAGVSRQTVYRHFGNRDVLIDETVVREERRLMDVMLTAIAGHPDDPRASLEAGLEACLTAARDHPLIGPLLETEPGELLPHILGPRQPVIGAAQDVLVEVMDSIAPGLTASEREMLSDAAVRLVISHVVTPSDAPVAETAKFLSDVIVTWLESHDATIDPTA